MGWSNGNLPSNLFSFIGTHHRFPEVHHFDPWYVMVRPQWTHPRHPDLSSTEITVAIRWRHLNVEHTLWIRRHQRSGDPSAVEKCHLWEPEQTAVSRFIGWSPASSHRWDAQGEVCSPSARMDLPSTALPRSYDDSQLDSQLSNRVMLIDGYSMWCDPFLSIIDHFEIIVVYVRVVCIPQSIIRILWFVVVIFIR